MTSEGIYTTVRQYKSIYAYRESMDKQVELLLSENGSYARLVTDQIEDTREAIRRNNTDWLGEPLPASYEDAMARIEFLNMDLYKTAKEKIEPLLENLAKKSEAIIESPVIKPNDLELGVFSIDRAMMAIEPTPAFYSIKHKQYYTLDKGEDYKDKKTGETKYRLIQDGSPLELTTLEEDGEKIYYTENKKSFLYKVNVERPNKAVRLFILIGQNASYQPYWAGLAGTIIAQYLEAKGYNVCITCVVGVWRTEGGVYQKKTNQYADGIRFNMFNLKNYTDTYDTPVLLYPLCDNSFFRVRQFHYYVADQHYFQDRPYSYLGRLPQVQQFKDALAFEIKKRNIEKEENTIYKFIGGEEVRDEQTCIRMIEQIVLECEMENAELLKKVRQYQDTKTI